MKKNRGITLIALIITIIVLLILAGVAFSSLMGQDGLLNRVSDAAEVSRNAEKNQTETIKDYENDIDKWIGNGEVSPPTLPEIETPQTGGTEFSRGVGVIEIAWLDLNNNVIANPMSPVNYLGGMSPVKWNGVTEESAGTASNPDLDWYSYIAQTGNTETEGTSKWANAKTSNGSYFVWIPRYAYKIIYFGATTSPNKTAEENAEVYRADRTSTIGIVGYSTIYGFVDITSGIAKVVEGTEPSNVIGTVKTNGYKDYIPHPGFEFGGARAGIWVGKYESSSQNGEQGFSGDKVKIVPNVASWRGLNVSGMFAKIQNMASENGLTNIDSHMMKNIEWGAVAYLTESRYGRNGTEITINNHIGYKTGYAGYTVTASTTGTEKMQSDNSSTDGTFPYNNIYRGVLASTTGNITGIYDLSGGAYEYVMGALSTATTGGTPTIGQSGFSVLPNEKYYDLYFRATTESKENNYGVSKSNKGDAVYETSTFVGSFINKDEPWIMRYSLFGYDANERWDMVPFLYVYRYDWISCGLFFNMMDV